MCVGKRLFDGTMNAPPMQWSTVAGSHQAGSNFCAKVTTTTTSNITMFSLLAFNLVTGYAEPYDTARGVYLTAAAALKEATGPYKAARDAYVAATATYTKSLYE